MNKVVGITVNSLIIEPGAPNAETMGVTVDFRPPVFKEFGEIDA